jgi:protein SCO1/2
VSYRNVLLAVLTVAALAAGALLARQLAPHDGPPLPPGGDFTLQSADGPVSLADLRGKVVLVYFGYTACPDVCPTSLAYITFALRALSPAEVERVRVLFVSVDPEHESLDRLKRYATAFHPAMIGATAAPEVLTGMAQRYGARFAVERIDSSLGYAVDHTSFTGVLAPDGRFVAHLPHGTPSEAIAEAIRRALRV